MEMPLLFPDCGNKSCEYWRAKGALSTSECCALKQQAADLAILRAERLKEAEWLEKWVLGAEVWPEGDESFDVEKLEGWVERIKAHIVSLEAGGKDGV